MRWPLRAAGPSSAAASGGGRPGALLTTAEACGTLAAARALGRRGLDVALAVGPGFAPARWSRFVGQVVAGPEAGAAPHAFVDWLCAVGARDPGRVLPATSDDVAWLFARYAHLLTPHFRLAVPSFEVVDTLLDKWRLAQACVAAGVPTPRTWRPRSVSDLAEVARDAAGPVVLKPRSQVLLTPHRKGVVVRELEELPAAWQSLARGLAVAPVVLEHEPEANLPLVQELSESAADGITNVSGFVDARGRHFVCQASRKVLQWPRRMGIGLCFEEVATPPELAAAVARLCAHVGYSGAFEVEFVETPRGHALIDFNPRFYGQLGFDVARGLDLPWLVYLAAVRADEALARAVDEAARASRQQSGRAYCHRAELELVLRLRHAAHAIAPDEEARWRGWLLAHDGRLTDAALDGQDWTPALVDVAAVAWARARHPRAAWRAAQQA